MSTKVGKVVDVSFDIMAEKQGGGDYPAWQLIYTTPEGRVEKLVKHMNSLKFVPGLRSSLEGLEKNDDVTITLEKKGQFNEVTAITKGITSTPSVSGAGTTTKVIGSNYETKEERAARQRLIVRQSSITAALAFLGGKPGDINKVLETAEQFCDWVFEVKPDKEVE